MLFNPPAQSVRFSLYTLLLCLFLAIAHAGEVILSFDNDTTCEANNPGYFLIWSASESSKCVAAPAAVYPVVYGLANRRPISPACTFYAYTDTKCADLAVKLQSTTVSGTCHKVNKSVQSLKVSCQHTGAVPRDVDSMEEPYAGSRAIDAADQSNYLQESYMYYSTEPVVSGGGYGGRDIYIDFIFFGTKLSNSPVGPISAAAVALTESFYKNVPKTGQTFTASASASGSSRFSITVAGDQITALQVSKIVSGPSFASIMADTMAALVQNPSTSIAYSVYDPDTRIANFNMTYT